MASSAGTTYTYAQLEQLWINAGGSKSTAPVAAAIAEAESGGNPKATNPADNNGTQTSWGLWQVSNGTHAQPVPNVLDPNVNAAAAVAKYQAAGGWSPWGTYSSGAYRNFLSPGTSPDPNVPAGAVTTAASGNAADTAGCLVGIPQFSVPVVGTSIGGGCWFTRSEARAVIGGGLLAAAGVLGLVAVLILAASAFQRTGAAAAVGQVRRTLPFVP
jgi:hypothetical protein